jgi:hypothetical protein
MSAPPLSNDTLLQFLSGCGGATIAQLQAWHRQQQGPAAAAAQAGQLQNCLTSLQECFAIYEDNGRFCPM